MNNNDILKHPGIEKHLRFSLGVIVGVIFGIILGAIASYSYVTTFASSLSSITHITKDINKLISFSYDSNRWNRDEEKLTLKTNPYCQIFAGIEEVDLTNLNLSEQKLKIYNNIAASDSIYLAPDNRPQKRIVSFDITPTLGEKPIETSINYIFCMQASSNFEGCSNEFENVLNTFTLKDVKK